MIDCEEYRHKKIYKYRLGFHSCYYDGDNGTAYVHLVTGEFVKVKDKLYEVSGNSGEAILTFTYGEEPVLNDIEWADDGELYESWIKDNFSKDEKKGTYEIIKTIETGNPADDSYKFDTETIEKGKISDLE